MIRSTSHWFLLAFLRTLTILAIVVGQGAFGPLPAHGQAQRLAVRIAYVYQGNIWVLDAVSGRRMRLTSDGQDSGPVWTSNGQALLFQRQAGMRPQIWRWQPGSGIRRLREGLWSPDGSAVAFDRTARNAGSATAVWITRNGRTVRITPIQPDFRWFPAAWSPDSSRLVLARFAVPPGTKPAYAVPSGPASLWLASGALGVSNLKRLPLPPAFGGQPGWPDVVFWSPDGRFVTVGVGPNQACNSCRADGRQYYAISAADGTFVALGTALSPDEAISWSPDGSYAVLSSGRLSRETYADKHLVQMSPITGTRHALTHGKRWADVEPAVVPDGKHIAFARGLAATPSTRLTNVQLIASRRLFLMDANGAQLHRLTSAPGWTDEAPVWSPDGHLLIFVRWRRHLGSQAAAAALWAVRADGTGAQRLAGLDLPSGFLNGFGYYGSFGWHDLFAVAP